VKSADVMINVLAPGVIEKHITLGATYQPNAKDEWSFAYWRAPQTSVSGDAYDFSPLFRDPPSFPTPFPASIRMKQQGFGIQYSRKF
jgi:long-chain fatty acid transport protein